MVLALRDRRWPCVGLDCEGRPGGLHRRGNSAQCSDGTVRHPLRSSGQTLHYAARAETHCTTTRRASGAHQHPSNTHTHKRARRHIYAYAHKHTHHTHALTYHIHTHKRTHTNTHHTHLYTQRQMHFSTSCWPIARKHASC